MLERDMLAPHGLAKWAAIDPDQIALEHVDGQSLTYAELDRDGRTWASALQRIGVGVGTHVATLLPNIFDAHRTMLGLGVAARGRDPTQHRVHRADARVHARVLGHRGARHHDARSSIRSSRSRRDSPRSAPSS